MNTAKSLLALSRYQAQKESEKEIRKLKDIIKKQDALLKKVLEKELESDERSKGTNRTIVKE